MGIKQLPQSKVLLIAIIIISGLIYLKSGSFRFVNWDDDENIRSNVRYKELNYNNLKYHFQNSRYKALAIWSFMVDAKLFPKKPTGFHIHNVLLHLANILLVFFLIRRITQKDIIALITTVLFALHPAFVEPVAWVTGRKDLLFLLFSLLATLAYINYLNDKKKILWIIVVTICLYLASLAKIQAVTVVLIFFLLDWFYQRKLSFLLFAEKAAFGALLFDKWLIAGVIFICFICYHYFIKYYSIKYFNKTVVILLWYLLASLLGLTIISFPFLKDITSSTSWGFRIIQIGLILVYGIIVVIAVKKRSIITTKLATLRPVWILFLFIVPVFFYFARIGYGILRTMSFKGLWTLDPGAINYFTLPERFVLAPISLLYYISRFFLISPQDPMIPYPGRTAGGGLPTSMIIISVIVYVVVLALAFLIFKKFRKQKTIIFGLLWFLASISIVMHIIPIEGRVLVADRYTYPAYIGLFLIIGILGDFLISKVKKTYILAGMTVIVIILCIRTSIDLVTWKSSKSLWEKAIKENPQNHYAMYSLSLAYFAEEKKSDKALFYLDKAIKLKEDFQYLNNRGRIRYAVGNINGAVDDINKSIELDSNSFAAYNNRGVIRQMQGDLKLAQADFEKAVKLNPKFLDAINNLQHVRQLIQIDKMLIANQVIPYEKRHEVTEYIIYISEAHIRKKEIEKAAFYLSKGINMDPSNTIFHEKMAVMYQLNKQTQKALSAYEKGLFCIPGDPTLLFGKGILLLENGDTLAACKDFALSAQKGNKDAANLSRRFCGGMAY